MGEFPAQYRPRAYLEGYLPIIRLDLVRRLTAQPWGMNLALKRGPPMSADRAISGRARHVASVYARLLPHRSFICACASGEPS